MPADVAVRHNSQQCLLCIDHHNVTEALARHHNQRIRHGGRGPGERQRVTGVHQFARGEQPAAQFPARMKPGEVRRGESLSLHERGSQRIPQRQGRGRGRHGREANWTRFAFDSGREDDAGRRAEQTVHARGNRDQRHVVVVAVGKQIGEFARPAGV